MNERGELLGMFYACIEDKEGNVVRYVFQTREAARKYIATHFDKDKHNKCWTE